MRVLNIEDTPTKHRAIRDVLESCRVTDIDHEMYLDDGVARYKEALAAGNPYDLLITDMWYPPEKGMKEAECGDILVKLADKEHWDVPILVCSNQHYNYQNILGTLYFSENVDWEGQLRKYVEEIKKKK
ncbi:response regulator [Butyrivibrio sp. CB08]|uniref:response regulator n=1 Tax=Butyrivibrio sp. CB08 TaxID=2364879 RepID=UPI000EA9E03B|nr:response regulator [Butyrivibrio sp. CB08]RKM61329.1 response regulator [Butyrivibrio sp. CB08]